MDADSKSSRIALDWSRLLGFDQAGRPVEAPASEGLSDPRVAMLGAKVGGKRGSKQP